ncbi:hypothetical protein JCM16303_005856 [Sporobolomyces ruberrimus]
MSSAFDDMMSPFLGLPGFSPLASFNLSGTSATTRLLQVPMLGLSTVDVSGKFAPHKKAGSTDLGPESWEEMKRLLEDIKGRLNKGLKRQRDKSGTRSYFGHLVFSNGTFSKFLLVNSYDAPACDCGNPYHGDYSSIIKIQAQKFLNLLTVLPRDNRKIDFVRATFCTTAQRVPTDDFLFGEKPFTPRKNSLTPPIVHLTPADLVPSLTDHDLEVISATAAKGNEKLSEDKKKLVRTTEKVGSANAFKPQALPVQHTKEMERECGGCHKTFLPSKLSRCSACKVVMYCGPECQRAHWPQHKSICKLVQKNQKA